MAFRHQEIAVADARPSLGMNASVDDHVFTDHVVVADNTFRRLPFPAEVLRFGSDYGALIYAVVLAHAGAGEHRCVGLYFAAVADYDIFVDIGERVDGDVGADFGRSVDIS